MPRLAVALITCLTAFAAAAPAADAIGIIVPPPANDDWQNAANITVGSTATADTSGATTQASEPLTADPSCGDGQPANGGSRVGATVWYRITGNGRRVVVDTFGSTITTNENGTIGYDTLLAVYDGTTPSTAAGTFVECNDDFIAHGATFHSRVSFPTTQGHTYLVQAGGTTTGSSYPPDRGTIHVSLNEPPANDNRADAETLGPGEYTRSNRAGSYAADEPTSCSGTLYASTVWFRYAPATNGLAHFSSAGAPLPVLAVYDASAPTTQLGCSAASPAQVDRSLQAGHTYLVQVGGRDESSSGGGDVDPREGTLTYKLEWEPDTDNDGTLDSTDEDDDGDGTPDVLDAFPRDASESVDTDGDGTGDNADADDDNDGVADVLDAFPRDASESVDTDGDGTGDNHDGDDDADGVPDAQDQFPRDRTESRDFDHDGQGDNADPDDDNDGVVDTADRFPLNASESRDSDGDSQGDNADADDDGDGLSDADERRVHANPLDIDSDDDGLRDGEERRGTSPVKFDSDRDGLSDGLELGLKRGLIAPTPLLKGTKPSKFKADRDPKSHTSPLKADTDGDGRKDGAEDKNHNGRVDRGETDPRKKDGRRRHK